MTLLAYIFSMRTRRSVKSKKSSIKINVVRSTANRIGFVEIKPL